MNYKEFIKEVPIVKEIKKNCSQYLKESKGQYLFRGLKKNKEPYLKITPRTDRKPLDSSRQAQIGFNEWFEQKYGVKDIRSRAVFTNGYLDEAEGYGPPYVIFPGDGYTYWWSPEVRDLNDEYHTQDAKDYTEPDETLEWFDSFRRHKIPYKNIGLVKGITSGNEIMLLCKEYYAVRWVRTNISILEPFYKDIWDEF